MRETRSARLTEMLSQTDECLRVLARRLGISNLLAQQAPGDAPPGPPEGAGGVAGAPQQPQEGGSGGGGGLAASASAWSKLASMLVADVREQPRMLRGGQLRDYQMHVSAGAMAGAA